MRLKVQIWIHAIVFSGWVFSLGLTGCASSESTNTYKASDENRPLVDDKYRLTADREKFSEARTQIPQDKKIENDEIAFILQMMADPSKDPSRLREKFDSTMSKKREKFSKDLQRERDDFSKNEHQKRDDFLKKIADFRKEFLRTKHGKDERDDFYNHLEEQRKDFFENQREKRNDFEADVNGRRKDFDDYVRDRSADFRQQYVDFQHRHEDYLKEKEKEKEKQKKETAASPSPQSAAKPEPEVKSLLQDFNDIPATPGTHLESGQ